MSTKQIVTESVPTTKQAVNGNEIPLKRICAELGLDPKAARRKLRKVWRTKDSTLAHVLRDRWTGPELRAILAPTQQ